MKKFFALALALVMILSLGTVAMADGYYMTYNSYLIDAVGWWFCDDISLQVTGDTYSLEYRCNIFGTTDPGVKGSKTVIYTGKCSVAPSADGEASHLDVTIESVDTVMMEQHGKAWGRQVLNYQMVLDSANWDDMMEEMYGDTVEAFLENHQAPLGAVITVEDLALDYDDTTLENRIVSGLEDVVLDIAE